MANINIADILSSISLISFIAAIICLALAVFFWFKFRIPTVIGDLTGKTARKSIAKIREGNEASGNKSYRPSAANIKRGKLTDTMPGTEKSARTDEGPPLPDTAPTGIYEENRISGEMSERTEALEQDATEMLVDEGATELLVGDSETELLEETAQNRPAGKKLKMLDEVIQTHSDEVIE